jgi:hypothetical protein
MGVEKGLRDDWTPVKWMDKRDVCRLPNIHNPPKKGNFHDE